MKKTSREKLYEAAVELITVQGYDNTTVSQIASKAGLTERTFFRQFNNKADLFFDGGEQYSKMLLEKIQASKEKNPVLMVLDGYFFAASFFDEHRERTLKRQKIIASHPDLQERELLKQAKVEERLASGLKNYYDPATAILAVRIARAIYSLAWEEWLNNANGDKSLHRLLQKAIRSYEQIH